MEFGDRAVKPLENLRTALQEAGRDTKSLDVILGSLREALDGETIDLAKLKQQLDDQGIS